MSTSGPTERDPTAAIPQGTAPASLEQVREILFGAYFRDLDRKLARVDAHVSAESEELRKEMRRRLDVLETHVQRESEALVARFESEREAHVEAIAGLEQRLTKMAEALARAQRELRQQILDQAKGFLDETQRTRDEVVETLERDLAFPERERRDANGEVEPQDYRPGH